MAQPFDKKQALNFLELYRIGMHATPRAWAHKGENLMHAFEVLIAASDPNSFHLNLSDQAFMLAGMSAEVHLKAMITNDPLARCVVTASSEPGAGPDRKLWKAFRSHDLIELARIALLPLDDRQHTIATALSQYIYWRGRYVVPTAKGIDDLLPVEREDRLFGPIHHVSSAEVRDLLWHVINALKSRLYPQA